MVKKVPIKKKVALRGRLGGQLGTLQGSIWRTNKGLEGLGDGYWSLNRIGIFDTIS